jgi:hypothetical protein
MTDFSTPFCKKALLEWAWRRWLALACVVFSAVAQAQGQIETVKLRVERVDEQIALSAQLQFELAPAVEDALLKGIPMVFVMTADVLRERWYWYDSRVASAARSFRLAYQPLTGRWRLNVTSGVGAAAPMGLALNQTFDTLALALAAIRRVSNWAIADAGNVELSQKHRVEFRFRLDLAQLPRPFQIGMLGDSDWDIAVAAQAPLAIETGK